MRLSMAVMSSKNLIYTSICSFCSTLSFGYMIGYSSPALPQMTAVGQPMHGNDNAASWFGSLATLSAMVGCPIAGLMVDRIGRKRTLLFTAIPFLAGWIAIWSGVHLNVLYAGRLLTGFGSGMSCIVAPLYISETSTKEFRGMLGSGVQLSVTIGIVLVYLLGMFLDWRMLALVGAVIPIMSVFLTLHGPETPRYLINSGQRVDALRSLLWLRGTSAIAEEECRDMEEIVDAGEKKTTWKEFRKPELYRPLMLCSAIMAFQQLGGINVVMFYTVSIFQSAGFNKETSGLATVAIGAVQVIGTIAACYFMDRTGRRKLLIIGGLGMGITCFTMAFYYYQTLEPAASTVNGPKSELQAAAQFGWLAVTSLICYTLAFAIGWGPIPMLLMSEIFPPHARGVASAAASLVNWTLAFVITNQFTSLTTVIGSHGTFCLFGGFCMLSVVYVHLCVPETKGKSLEDIELYFLATRRV